MSEPTLNELLYGKGAHANSIACIEGLTADVASRQVAGFPHSIWQLVFHLNYWIDYDLRRIEGERPPYPAHAAESWPNRPAPADEAEWKRETDRFVVLLRKVASLANSSPVQLQREVEAMHPAHGKQSSSVLAVLWQTVVHNSYHLGQIALLRRSLNAWPPPGGGDTW
jgi:uncharacterized damage-inducible protein DinB